MQTLEIVAIEDNPPDLFWLNHILHEAGLPYHLTVAGDGETAVECLLRTKRYQGTPSPDLIFMDMNLPKFGGLEILRRVPNSADMPICVLTGSEKERAAALAHFGKAFSYLIKPLTAANLMSCLKSQLLKTPAELS